MSRGLRVKHVESTTVGGDMKLKVVVTSKAPALQTHGEVYTVAGIDHDPPVVSDVIASNGKESYFSLDPGSYVYAFAIGNGMGALTVTVALAATGEALASDDFDTKYGYYGNELKFEVK